MDEIVVVGSSGHAKVILDMIEKQRCYRVLGLIDSFEPRGKRCMGYEIIGSEDDLPGLVGEGKPLGVVVAIGDNYNRHLMVEKFKGIWPQISFPVIVHPHSAIARDVELGEGTVVMAGVVINSEARVGRFCILNTSCSLDHEAEMGDFSSLAPNASLGGNVQVGPFAAVGLGAAVIHGIRIGEHAVIGAGATVIDDVEPYSVAYGTPARSVRKRKAGERYL